MRLCWEWTQNQQLKLPSEIKEGDMDEKIELGLQYCLEPHYQVLIFWMVTNY